MKFSIVIPTYNRADFIEKTINSVLNQTYENFEIILVDDGSTDKTGEIVSSINDPRLIYRYKINEERAVARNTGTALATGDYVTFLDSDDLLYRNHLEIAFEVIKKYKIPEFVHLGYEIVDEKKNTVRKVNNFFGDIESKTLLTGNFFSCNNVFLRKDIAVKHPFNPDRDLSGTEDYELWLRLASRYPLYCDNKITSAIIQHEDRSVVTTNKVKLIKRIELLEKYLFEDEKFMEIFKDDIKIFQAHNRIYIALHLALTKQNRFQSLKYLAKSLLKSPGSLKNRAFYGTLKRLFI